MYMMNKVKKWITASVIVVMGLFNIGIPVVYSFCPMQGFNPVCCQLPSSNLNDTSAISRQIHSCCNTFVVAEPNTNPFLNPQQTISLERIFLQAIGNVVSLKTNSSPLSLTFEIDTSPSSETLPLFLLNSNFRI